MQTSFFRKNLQFRITPCEESEKFNALLASLSVDGRLPAIVYGTRRETVESLATFLRSHDIKARAYHAGMPAEARSEVQDQFLSGEVAVICATIAFGMGVDMLGVRAVIHFQPPKSPEGWVQESGRAGRDGKISHCELLISENDRAMLESFVLAQKPTKRAILKVLTALFSQGSRAVVSRYDLSTLNDISVPMLGILFARLEMRGAITSDQGSWLWCHAVPLISIDRVLLGFSAAEQKRLQPLLESRKRLSLMEMSGGSVVGQLKLMRLLSELNASGDVRMKFSHNLQHFRIRKLPNDISAENYLNALADTMYDVFERHSDRELKRIDSVMKIATSRKCLAWSLLNHFGEKLTQPCGVCTSCLGEPRPRKLPFTPIPEVTQEELAMIQSIIAERKPALATPERLSRFLAGIYSPGMMRYRLYQHQHWGALRRLPFDEILAYSQAQNF